jgi:hypothetical protein
VSGQLHDVAALHQGNSLLEPIVQETVWAPEPVWALWKRENSAIVFISFHLFKCMKTAKILLDQAYFAHKKS